MVLIILYGIYFIKHYFFRFIDENISSFSSQLRQAPTTYLLSTIRRRGDIARVLLKAMLYRCVFRCFLNELTVPHSLIVS